MQEIRRFLLKDDVYKEVYGVLTYTLPEKRFEFYIHEGYPDTHYPPFVKEARERGCRKMPQDLMKYFIRERLIPPNRHNILQILRNAGLSEYDEFGMLMFTDGKCCQDYMYLEEITDSDYQCYKKEWQLEE